MPYRDPERQRRYMREWRATRRQQTQSLRAEVAALCERAQAARTAPELALLVRPLCQVLQRLVQLVGRRSGSRQQPGGDTEIARTQEQATAALAQELREWSQRQRVPRPPQ